MGDGTERTGGPAGETADERAGPSDETASPHVLEAAEERWRLILQTAHDAFISIDETSRVIEWNRRAEDVFGWSRDEVIGTNLTELIIPLEFRASHREGVRRFLEAGEGPVLFQTVELPALRRDGTRFDAEVTIWPHEVEERWTFHAFIRDITERKRNRRHVDLLQRVTAVANTSSEIEATSRAILEEVCDVTGWPIGHTYLTAPDEPDLLRPTSWWYGAADHDTFVELTGQTTFDRGEGLPGRVLASGEPAWISDLADDPNFPRAPAALDSGLRAAFGFPVRSGDDVVAVLEFYSTEVSEPDGPLLELMSDVGTQLGRVFERVRATEQLRAADRLKSRLIATVSHEIRTPLAIISGIGELLTDDWDAIDEEEKRTYAESIRRQSVRLTRLAEALLTTSRLEAGVMEPRPHDVPLADSVREVVRDTSIDDVVLDIDPAIAVHVDREHLTRILTNLLTNAEQHGEPPVRVDVRTDDGTVSLTVSDDGNGIPTVVEDTLFERFVTSLDGSDGTGLGLSISRDLARMNGGDLRYDGTRGGRTTFVLELPMP